MTKMRTNDPPEDGTYVSRARQAIENGINANDETGDKQAGDGLVQVSLDELNQSLDIIHALKESMPEGSEYSGKLEELQETLEDMINDH
jgi:hypothetical protein